MRYIEKLLEGVKVEWKTLGEVTEIFTGGEAPLNCTKGTTPDNINKYPIYGNGAEIYGYTDTYRIDKDAVTISSIGANTGNIYFREACFTPIIRLKVVIPKYNNLLPRYIFHYLNSITIGSKSSSIPNMNASDVKKIPIPLPPLPVQTEIVRILDTFTERTETLINELATELEARKKQYNYYREKLLSFKEGEVEWKTLGEVAKILRGRRLIKSELEMSGKYAVFQNSMKPLGYYHESNVLADTAFIISAGSAGEIGYSAVDFWAADDVYYFLTPKNLKSKFLYYFLLTQQTKITGQVRRASVPRLSKTAFEKMLIPIPSPEEQERIVAILDKFDSLTALISEALPKEIALRKKQYEYYRDLLLTFPNDNLKV